MTFEEAVHSVRMTLDAGFLYSKLTVRAPVHIFVSSAAPYSVDRHSEGRFFCRYAKEICDSIVAKCMTGRPKTLEKSQAVFLLWVELEATDAFLV